MPHSLIWKVFDYFRVPVVVVNLIRAYFQDIRLCLSTASFTTGWQRLKNNHYGRVYDFSIGIYNAIIIRASKCVVGGERR